MNAFTLSAKPAMRARWRRASRLMALAFLMAAAALAPRSARAAAPFDRLRFQSGGRTITMARWSAGTAGRRPAILLLHGGGGPQLIENDPNYRAYPEALAAAGYMVYMPYFWESTAPDDDSTPANFAVWLRTAENALAWINRQPEVEPGHIGAIGLSLGGHLGLALAAQDRGLRAFVDFYGWLTDDEARRVSRMAPTLILHGDADVLVDVEEARKLRRLFDTHHITYEQRIYRGQNHGFTGADLQDSIHRMLAFLDKRVR